MQVVEVLVERLLLSLADFENNKTRFLTEREAGAIQEDTELPS